MEKRGTYERHSKRVKVVEEEPKPQAYIPQTVQLRLLREIQLRIKGPYTGALYTFNGAGSVVAVDERDLPLLLEKGVRTSCCGGIGSPYFELLGG